MVVASVLNSVLRAEFLVNTQTTYNQTDPAVVMDAAGGFLVVWSSYRQDGDSGGVFAQRFDPNCRAVGPEFSVNTTIQGNQTDPAAAMRKTGDFIVVWHGPGVEDQDIFARRFDPKTDPLGLEFRVNNVTDNRQRLPRAALSPTGACVIVWESEQSAGETYAWTVAGQLYNANGAAIGNEFRPSQLTDCRYPDVAMDAHGNFIVVWLEDKSTNSIMARLYDSQGRAQTAPFKVSSGRFSSQTRPAVAMDYSGNFIVTWDGHEQSSIMDDIHARCYNFDGTPINEQFIVNTTNPLAQRNPRIAATSQGEFVIVWHSENAVEEHGKDVFAQRFNSLGMPLGDELQLNSYITDDQKYPSVAISQNGRFIAAWQSFRQDGSHFGIFATSGSGTCTADFSNDGIVNFRDYCILGDEWLTSGDSLTSDLLKDNKINAHDLAEFCRAWLTLCRQCDQEYSQPAPGTPSPF